MNNFNLKEKGEKKKGKNWGGQKNLWLDEDHAGFFGVTRRPPQNTNMSVHINKNIPD